MTGEDDEMLRGYNLGRESVGLPPARFVGEDADEWDLCLVEHHECASVLRAAEIPAFAMDEPWKEHLTTGARVLLVDRTARVAGDLRAHYPIGELLFTRTPSPYRFPSEFLQARMAVSGVKITDKPEVRELWRIVTHANQTWIVDQDVEPTRNPDMLPAPQLPQMSPWRAIADAPAPEWVLDSLIAKDSIVMLASSPASGKSLLVLDWCLRMQHGMSWFGRRMQPGSVLYLCGEGAGGIGGRIRAWVAAHSSEQADPDHYLEFSHSIPVLSTPAGCVELGGMLEKLAKQYGHTPSLVVVDTLSQSFGAGDENDAATVAPALKALAELRQRFHFSILVLHHTKKEQAVLSLNSVRGSGAFTANVDIVLGLEVQDGIRTLRTLKLKDGEMAPPISFEIRGQETGHYLKDGDTERAPIIVPARDDAAEAKTSANDRAILAKIGAAARNGLSLPQIASYTGIAERLVFESVVRLEQHGSIAKTEGRSPRYYLPAYAPPSKDKP